MRVKNNLVSLLIFTHLFFLNSCTLFKTRDIAQITSEKEKIVVLESAQKSLEARVELIMNAEKTIDAQYYAIEHDYVSISGLALIRAAAQRGVKVRILVDSLNNLMTREMMSALLNHLSETAQNNIQIREFNKFNIFRPLCVTRRMHDKSLVIDNKYLIIGDRNIASGYFNIPEGEGINAMPTFEGTDVLIAGAKSSENASDYFNQRWNSKDVKPVRLKDYSKSSLDYSYCHYQLPEDFETCEKYRIEALTKVHQEIEKLDNYYSNLIQKNSKILQERPLLKKLTEAYESSDIKFLHDNPDRRVCKGKDSEFNIGKNLYQIIKENTKNELTVVSPYLIISKEMESLIRMLVEERNVSVRFITNSTKANDVPSAAAGYTKTRALLMNIKNKSTGNSVEIFEYENISQPQLLNANQKLIRSDNVVDTVHTKMVVMDNKMVFIGSYNWDHRSQNLNSEVGVVMNLENKDNIPLTDIQNRIDEFYENGHIVIQPIQNRKFKFKIPLNRKDRNEINKVLNKRERAVERWKKLLSIPLIGPLIIKQL